MQAEPRKPTTPPRSRHWLFRPIRVGAMRRHHRWAIRLILLGPALAVIGLIVITRTAVTRWAIVPRLEHALNMQVAAEAVFVRVDGTLVIDRARFHLPGVDGPAGDFLKVGRIEADVDWLGSLGGRPRIRSVKLLEPLVVISESLETRSLNLDKLDLPSSSGDMALPVIRAENAGIELGENRGVNYTPLKRIQMEGILARSNVDPSGYAFQLVEKTTRPRRPGEPGQGGFRLVGTLGTGRLSVDMVNFSLDAWQPQNVPSTVRGLFQDLELRGEVSQARLTYSKDDGLAASLTLDGVAMNLPVRPTVVTASAGGDAPDAGVVEIEGPPTRLARMSGVHGGITFARDTVKADVGGVVEDMPYRVRLDYAGTSVDSPFRCEFVSTDFQVRKNPRLLPFAPPVVKERLQSFSSPTAIVNTRVIVERGAPVDGRPGEISVSGSLEMREGVAAYEGFPYEFRNLRGTFRFDESRIEFTDVTGESPSGAALRAHGLISPLDENAQVDIYVDVRHAPIDDAMQAAFGPGRDQLIPALFSTPRYTELRELGMVQTSDEARAAEAEFERIDALLAAASPDQRHALEQLRDAARRRADTPIFDFRGTADVSIAVHRPRGDEVEWQTIVDVNIAHAGLLPEKFPLPIQAENVTARVVNTRGELLGGTFRGATGGQAGVHATFSVPRTSDPDPQLAPEIVIAAADLPIDGLLIHALPGGEPAPEPGLAAGRPSIKRILRDLNISGLGDGSLRIAQRPSGELGFDADFIIEGVRMTPPGADPAAAIGGIGGHLTASESSLAIDLLGQLRVRTAEQERPASGDLSAEIRAEFPTGGTPSYRARVKAPDLDLAAPLDALIRVFSPSASERIAALQREHRPTGAADVDLDAASIPGAPAEAAPAIHISLAPRRDVGFEALGLPLVWHAAGGAAIITTGPAPAALALDDLRGALDSGGRPAGELAISGGLGLESPQDSHGLFARVSSGRFESSLLRELAARQGGDLAASLEDLNPEGLFQAKLWLWPAREGWQARGVLEPQSLSIDRAGSRISFTSASGSVEFEPGSGTLRGLWLRARDWSISANGAWVADPAGTLQLNAELGLAAASLAPDLLAALPDALSQVLRDLQFRVDGPLTLEDGVLALTRGNGPGAASTRFTGTLSLEDAALEAGLSLEGIAGSADISFQRRGEQAPTFRIDALADRLRTSGVGASGISAIIQSGPRPGEVLLTDASGRLHGGRFAARAHVSPGGAEPLGPAEANARQYAAELRLSGIRFKNLLDELSAGLNVGQLSGSEPDDRSRGLLDGSVALEGWIGRPQTRRGRGAIRISGGHVVTLPFVLRLVEVSNLQLPTSSQLDHARAAFYLDGEVLTFEELSLISSRVEILGAGTITWPEKRLSLRFNSRSTRPIPILSQLIQGIRDEFITTEIRGTLADPDIHLRQFPGARRILARGTSRDASRRADVEPDPARSPLRQTSGGISPRPLSGVTGDQP